METFVDVSIDFDVKEFIQNVLDKVHKNEYKRDIEGDSSYSQQYRFSCPYCGDSDNIKKKRGNFYKNSLTYYCFNCGIYKNIKDFYIDFKMKQYDKSLINKIFAVNNANSKNEFRQKNEQFKDFLIGEYYQYFFTYNDIIDMYGFSNIENTKGEEYLHNRRIYSIGESFLYDNQYDAVVILNMIKGKKKDEKSIISFQRRFLKENPNFSKYQTFGNHKLLEKINKIYESDEHIHYMKKLSTTYNIFNIQVNKNITVFEGPLDSELYENSIATMTIHNTPLYENKLFRYIFDFDTEGNKKSLDFVLKNKTVFLWKKLFNKIGYNEYNHNKKVDWGDITDFIYKNKIYITKNDIEECFTNCIFEYSSYDYV